MRKRPLPEYFKGLTCEIENCTEPASCMIRTKHVCGQCFSIILKDNILRFENDVDITDELLVHKNCYKYKCINKIPTVMKYTIINGEKVLLPKYCSNDCEQKDIRTKEGYRQFLMGR